MPCLSRYGESLDQCRMAKGEVEDRVSTVPYTSQTASSGPSALTHMYSGLVKPDALHAATPATNAPHAVHGQLVCFQTCRKGVTHCLVICWHEY
jgi:hypothetical protein